MSASITLLEQEIPRTEQDPELAGKANKEEMNTTTGDTAQPHSLFNKKSSRSTKTGRVLYAHHDQLRLSLNFQVLHPFLSREKLIPVNKQGEFIQNVRDEAKEECLSHLMALSKDVNSPEMLDRYLDAFQRLSSLNNPLTRHDQIDRLLSILSESRDPECMKKFIKCLRDSSNESYAGEAHLDLADKLETAWKSPEFDVSTFEFSHQNRSTEITVEGKNRERFEKCRAAFQFLRSPKFLCCSGTLILLVIVGVVATATVSQVPTVQSPSSSMSLVAHGKDIAEVNLADDLKLVSNVELMLGPYSFGDSDNCDGTMHVFRGIECSSLNTTTRMRSSIITPQVRIRFTPQLLYLLPGSEITISFDSRNVVSDFVSIVVGVEAYRKCSKNPSGCSCEGLQSLSPDLYRCFNVSEYLDSGRTIVFAVNSSNYYSVFDVDQNYHGMIYMVFEVMYDLSSSRLNEELTANRFETTSEEIASVVLNENWQFDPPSCVLFESNCPFDTGDDHANLTITSVQRRQDIVLFPGLFLLLVVLVSCCIIVGACVIRWVKKRGGGQISG